MSSAMRCCLTAVLLGTGASWSPPAHAQDIRELERRVDLAVARWKEATAALTAHDGLLIASREFPDTVVTLNGAIRIVTSREFLEVARTGGTMADAFIRERAGSRDLSAASAVFSLWTDSVRRRQHGLIISPRVGGRETGETYIFEDARSVARVLVEHAQRALGSGENAAFEAWLPGGLPTDTASNTDWRVVRLQLVSSRSTIARRCYAGDVRACKATLGLIDEPDPTMSWYDSAGRVAIVEAARKSARIDQRDAATCVAGNDAECVRMMRTNNVLAQWGAPPGSSQARLTLVQQALVMGGPGALERLAGGSNTPADALSALAKAPTDSVIAHWQRRVHDGGIESENASAVIAFTAIAWILVMGAVSLRSPRWR